MGQCVTDVRHESQLRMKKISCYEDDFEVNKTF